MARPATSERDHEIADAKNRRIAKQGRTPKQRQPARRAASDGTPRATGTHLARKIKESWDENGPGSTATPL
ncbi:hypothetical protein ACFW18_30395, partial [Micromonospora echinospora]